MFVEYVVVLFCACLCRGEDTPTYENDVCCGYGMFGFRLMVFVEYAVVLFCACLCRGGDTPTYGNDVYFHSLLLCTNPCLRGLFLIYSILSNQSFSSRIVCS